MDEPSLIGIKGSDRHALESERLVAAVDDGRLAAHVFVAFGENRKVLAEVRVERGGRLDLRGNKRSAGMLHKINFYALGVSIEIEVWSSAIVVGSFHRLKNDEIFEKTSTKRVAVQLFNITDFGQCAGEAGVVEIELGRLDEPLAPVFVPRRQEEADVRSVEDGEPFHHSLRGDAGVVGNGCDVENRANAPNENPKEVCEKQRVLDFEKLVNVAFHIGIDIAPEKSLVPYASSEETRIAACENGGKHVAPCLKHVRFPKAEWEQCEDRTASGKCLADAFHKEKVAGAGEDKKPVDAFFIHDPLYVGEQIGDALNFIENRAVWEFLEESPWIAPGKSTHVGIFKRTIGLVGEEHFGKRCLARLPRADNCYDREFRCRLPHRRRDMSLNVHGAYYNRPRRTVQYGKLTSHIARIRDFSIAHDQNESDRVHDTCQNFCYNTDISCKRDDPIFDIGPCQLVGRAPRARRRAATGHRPEALVGSRVPRDRIRGNGQNTRNSVLGFVAKPLTFRRKTEYSGASRIIHAAYPLFWFFVKVLSGTCHETGFRGCAAFLFRAEAAALVETDAGKE